MVSETLDRTLETRDIIEEGMEGNVRDNTRNKCILYHTEAQLLSHIAFGNKE
jgi:hypothetical protein